MGLHIDENNQTEIIPISTTRALTLFFGDDLDPTFFYSVIKQLNRNKNKTGAFSREVFDWFSVIATAQGLVIKLGLIGYSTGSTYSLEYGSNSNRNQYQYQLSALPSNSSRVQCSHRDGLYPRFSCTVSKKNNRDNNKTGTF